MSSRGFRSREERRKLPMWYRALSAVLMLLAVAAVCFCGGLALVARMGDAGDPVLGAVVLRVDSGSMQPALEQGDVVLFDVYDGEGLNEGDIVLFVAPSGAHEGERITHRILRVTETEEGKVYVTKGDAAATEDAWTLTDADIEGVYVKKLPLVADVAGYMQSAGGRMLVIGLPLILLAAVFIADSVVAGRLAEAEKKRRGEGEDIAR